jgi:cytochrome c biogenesis protein CcmG, thiol:disulfide interchange protein DsbE
MARRLKLVLQAAAVLVVALLVSLLGWRVAQQEEGRNLSGALAAGKRPLAPDFALDSLDGSRKISLSDLRGKVVVVNFWASWCPPCIDELPLLQRTQSSIENRGGTVLGVNYKDIPEDALRLVRRSALSYPSLRDRDGEYAEDYATSGIPETFLIDRHGRIAASRRGPVDQRWLNSKLRPLLEEGA